MDWGGLGDMISRYMMGNGGQRDYSAPIGPTAGGAPMNAQMVPGFGGTPGGGMSLALAGPILQGLMQSPETNYASPQIMDHGGQPVRFAQMAQTNPLSRRHGGA